MSIVSIRNCRRIAFARAPSAILMPISRVRSSTTTFMMFETPMPPTMSVNEPMIPRKSRNDRKKISKN